MTAVLPGATVFGSFGFESRPRATCPPFRANFDASMQSRVPLSPPARHNVHILANSVPSSVPVQSAPRRKRRLPVSLRDEPVFLNPDISERPAKRQLIPGQLRNAGRPEFEHSSSPSSVTDDSDVTMEDEMDSNGTSSVLVPFSAHPVTTSIQNDQPLATTSRKRGHPQSASASFTESHKRQKRNPTTVTLDRRKESSDLQFDDVWDSMTSDEMKCALQSHQFLHQKSQTSRLGYKIPKECMQLIVKNDADRMKSAILARAAKSSSEGGDAEPNFYVYNPELHQLPVRDRFSSIVIEEIDNDDESHGHVEENNLSSIAGVDDEADAMEID